MLSLRPAVAAEAAWLAESAGRAAQWVTRWSEEEYRSALADPELSVLVFVEAGAPAGHALLAGLGARTGVELRRLVVDSPGRGVGSAALPLLLDHCFGVLGTHRVWLDVLPANSRARAVYRRLGFREEGVMVDALRWPDGLHTLVLMAMLASEWRKVPAQ